MDEKKYYTAKEAQEILGMTYSALRYQASIGNIRSIIPPGRRQAVYVKEDIDRLKQPEEKKYYTAKEAQEILGMTYSALRNQVNAGNIRSVTLLGKSQAIYAKEDVDQLAQEIKIFIASKKKHPTTFSKVTTREELLESTKISDDIFGGHINIERLVTWIRRNPEVCYVAKNEGKVIGYAIILPLTFEKIEKLLREEEFAININAEEIGDFAPGLLVHLYMGAIGVIPGITLTEKRYYGSKLISGLIKTIIDLGKRGVIIRTITARSTKPDGIRLLREIGFTEILSTTEKKNFIIDVERSGIREIKQYKQALQESGFYTFPLDLNELSESILPKNNLDRQAWSE